MDFPSRPSGEAAGDLAAAIRARLGETLVGRRLEAHDVVDSTHDLARRAIHAARDPTSVADLDGLVFLASHQRKGRGRLGRSWVSTPGTAFLGSIVLAPGGRIDRVPVAAWTAAAALAVTDSIATFLALAPAIKWPNDVFLSGRKVAGILIEALPSPTGEAVCVVGVGINANQSSEDFPPELRATATSLRIASGSAVGLVDLAVAVLRSLDARYALLRSGAWGEMERDFLDRLGLRGRRVRVLAGDRVTEGRLDAISFLEGIRLTGLEGPATLPCETVRAIAAS